MKTPVPSKDFKIGDVVLISRVHYEDRCFARKAVQVDGLITDGPIMVKVAPIPGTRQTVNVVRSHGDGSYAFFGTALSGSRHMFFTADELGGLPIQFTRAFATKSRTAGNSGATL